MATSKPTTVAAYLAGLDPERRALISKVRQVVKTNLPRGYAEGMDYGVITWSIPLSKFSDTYNGRPLCYAALAAQKAHNALYLMGVYGDPKQQTFLREEFRKRGLKLDMGKSCLRFKRIEDLPLDVIAEVIARTPAEALMRAHDAAHAGKRKRKAAR